MARKSNGPTMSDVASRAGVSRALVSLVFRDQPGASEATRQKVRMAAAEIGYAPDLMARLLSRSRTGLIGVTFGLGLGFHNELLESLYDRTPLGFDLTIGGYGPRRSETDALRSLLAYRCEALILLGSGLPDHELAELAGRLPVVVVARRLSTAVRNSGACAVRTDDIAGAVAAVRHLTDLGHQRIGYAGAPGWPGDAERRRGVRTAIRRAQPSADLLLFDGGLTETDGIRVAEQLLMQRHNGSNLPTGLVAFNDHCALGIQATLARRRLKIPGDISLVGYDDIAAARLPWTDLTTIRQDAAELAGMALRTAVEQIAGRADGAVGGRSGTDTTVRPQLTVRSTTSAPGS